MSGPEETGDKPEAEPENQGFTVIHRVPMPPIEVNDNPLSLSLWRRQSMPNRGWHCTNIALPDRGKTFTDACAWCANPIGDEAHTVEHVGSTAALVTCRACQVALLGPEQRTKAGRKFADSRSETMEDLRYATTAKAVRSLKRSDMKNEENWTQVGDMSFRYLPPGYSDDLRAIVWQEEDTGWFWNIHLANGTEREGGPHYSVVEAAEDMLREHIGLQSA